jgi:hypothetical protein
MSVDHLKALGRTPELIMELSHAPPKERPPGPPESLLLSLLVATGTGRVSPRNRGGEDGSLHWIVRAQSGVGSPLE